MGVIELTVYEMGFFKRKKAPVVRYQGLHFIQAHRLGSQDARPASSKAQTRPWAVQGSSPIGVSSRLGAQ